jgi:hypothetical protein
MFITPANSVKVFGAWCDETTNRAANWVSEKSGSRLVEKLSFPSKPDDSTLAKILKAAMRLFALLATPVAFAAGLVGRVFCGNCCSASKPMPSPNKRL